MKLFVQMFVTKMEVLSLKLLVGVTLIFTMPIAAMSSINFVNCSYDSPYLLTEIAEPITYNINLTIKPHANIIIGTMNIAIRVKTLTRRISMHARGIELDFHNVTIKSTDSRESTVNVLFSIKECKNTEVLNLLFRNLINPGQYLLHLEFVINLDKKANTFRYPYFQNNVTGEWLFTNLHAQKAIRGLFPCWDQPQAKASFSISFKYPANYSYAVFWSSPLQNQWPVADNMILTQFHEISSMPTNLLAFAMVNKIVKTTSGINSVWYKLDASEKVKFTLEVMQSITDKMFNQTNMRVSVTQIINHIMIPDSPMKSMGRPRLIIYREKDVILEEDADIGGQIDVIKLITYETMLQCFDHLVGSYKYFDLWIHKILSSFYSHYVSSEIWDTNRFMDLFVVQSLLPALDSDDILELEPILHEVNDTDEIDELLYPLYHKKGAAIIRMLFYLVTPRKFQEAISRYLKIRTTDLWTHFEDVYPLKKENGNTTKEIMDSWLKTRYYPELFVVRNYENKTAECYAIFNDETITSHWRIPITFITLSHLVSNSTPRIRILTWYQWPNDMTITDIDPEDFIVMNVEHIGYYRVEYDHTNWYRIAAFLQYDDFSRIPVLSRAQLINDIYYFTMKHDLHSNIFFNIIRYLRREKDFVAWHPMFNILSYMSIYFKYPESYLAQMHFLDILNEIIKDDDYEFRHSDDNTMPEALRILAIKWACKLGHAGCKQAATATLISYLNNNKKIPSLWKDWVFCTGMMSANWSIWNIFLDKVQHYENPMRFFEYLSCAEDEHIILTYLDYLRRVNLKEIMGISIKEIFSSILKRHVGKNAVFNYILKNYDSIKRIYNESHTDILGVIIMNVHLEQQLNQVEGYTIEELTRDNFITYQVLTSSIDFILDYRRAQIEKELEAFKMF